MFGRLKLGMAFICGSALLCGCQAVVAREVPLTVQSDQLQIHLTGKHGRLIHFLDRQARWDHVAEPPNDLDLWELEFSRTGTNTLLSPEQASSFTAARRPGRRQVQLSWTGFGIVAAPNLKVVVTARLDLHSPISRWSIALENTTGLVLEKLRFPRFPAIRPQENERLAVPLWMGQLAENPRALLAGVGHKGARLEWDYPGLTSMQCLAFYRSNGPGLYFSCDDTACYRKSFALWGDADGQVRYEMVHVPEERESGRYVLPYEAIIGVFQGDWFSAAERYRAWATNQVWARASRLPLGLVPDWVRETGVWVWNRGRSENVLEPAMALQKELGLPVSVSWHWWHGCAYDTGFPEYLPPREGVQSFTNALGRAHQQGLHALVYMNQRLWGMTTSSWKDEGAEAYAVKGANGEVHPEIYNTFTRQPCASMCIGTGFWRKKYGGLAEAAFKALGVDGIYMDQACSSLACFDPHHGHAPGGGRYWMEGFRRLSADIRARCNGTGPGGGRQIALAGEGCGESWLPYLDLMLSLQVSRERYANPNDGWRPIPFFQAVYHPYGLLYGNYSSLTLPPYDELWPAEFAPKEPQKLLDRKYRRQFLLEQARAFVWGQQPTVANYLPNQRRERPEETAYLMQLARLRSRATRFLQDGVFLRPPELDVPQATLPLSRLSIYAGQHGALKSFEERYPVVLAGAWQAPDGDVAVALASIADEPVEVPLALDGKAYGLPTRGRILQLTPAGRQPLGKFSRKCVLANLSLAPREACLVEFVQSR